LVKRGRDLIGAGKIREARWVLKRAADAGDPAATLALATTYDPNVLKKLNSRDSDPDVGLAQAWYQKAADLGSTEAFVRLKRMDLKPDPRPPER
jgi:TPR repeat protein